MVDPDRYIEIKKKRINRALQNVVPDGGPPVIIRAMRYSLEAGGKRLRPVLTLAAAETFGAAEHEVIDVACAVEMVHTYSLIHDDLPAMDDSPMRRGEPTCHCVFGEAIAVLAGDALLTHAFEVLARYGQKEFCAGKAIKIIAELAKAAGVGGMIGGQVLDLEAEGRDLTAGQIENISILKTGAMLTAAVRCGAIAAGAGENELSILTRYASSLGTAFQIVDDLLDIEGTAEELGKPVGSDSAHDKATYPAVFGLQEASRRAGQYHRQAVEALEELERPAELLRTLADKIVFRKK
ncbi:MAG TPA: polyprenyl synthetase family protein [Firmicutes bacterium]|nr:polyprenyl synthetase family protein [Bacillota bacterium]